MAKILLFLFSRNKGAEADPVIVAGLIDGIVEFLSGMMPYRSSKKIIAMILLLFRMPVKDVVYYSGFKKSAVYSLRRAMRQLKKGADFLRFVERQCTIKKGRGRKSPVKGMSEYILEHIDTTNCFTLAGIQAWIFETFEITVSRSHISKFLIENGYKKLKSGSIPARADKQAQKTFYQDTLLPLMKKACSKGKAVVLSTDASHFVMGCDFIGSVYCKSRRFARSLSGRKRYNVLGALDFVTKKVITVTNDKYITSVSVCELLRKVRSAYKGKIIHLVLDNASYQKCACVTKLAGSLHIHLHFLPPYSPNLNLIERLWRSVKAELRRSSWNDYKSFSGKIDSIIETTTGENKDKIDSLIGEKVQLFDDYVEVDENTCCPPPTQTEREAS